MAHHGGVVTNIAMEEEEPASPATRLFHTPKLQCFVIAILGSKIKFDPDVLKQQALENLPYIPRFSSVLVKDEKRGTMRWTPTTVNPENHIFFPEIDNDMINLSPGEYIEEYISCLSSKPMDMTKPLWELHILNIKTTCENATAIFRIHHSMGDGISLMSILLALTRKTSDPESLPTIPGKKPKRVKNSRAIRRFFYAIWVLIMVFINTLVDVTLFLATTVFLKDTKSPIKGGHGIERTPKRSMQRFVSLDDMKLVKTATNATINDVVMGVIQSALSKYLNRKYASNDKQNRGAKTNTSSLPKNIRVRASLIFNIRKSAGLQVLADMIKKKSKAKWGNQIGYSLFPFKLSLCDDPLHYIREAQARLNRKKLSLEPIFSHHAALLMFKLFGVKTASALTYKVLINTTMCLSNVVGPQEEISFFGNPVTYIAHMVHGLPNALNFNFQSYINKMTIGLTYDPNVIRDPRQLLDDIEESLRNMKDAAMRIMLEKGDEP